MRHISRWYGGIGLILFIGVMIGTVGTVNAYLADGDQEINRLTMGGNQIRINEEFEPPEELIPGESVVKRVRVENCGHSDCYVRIKAVFTDSDVGQYCSLDWNTTDFVYREEDGFYYYRKAISSGEMTAFLFTTVSVSGEMPPGKKGDCSILVYGESCQAAGFDRYEDAWAFWGRNQS